MKKRTFIIIIAAVLVLCCVSFFVIMKTGASNLGRKKVSISYRTSFPAAYKDSNKGKVRAETPMVYKLLNIVIALPEMDSGFCPFPVDRRFP